MKKVFTLKSSISIMNCLDGCAALLSDGYVEYKIEGTRIVSTDIPFPLDRNDKRFYSDNNFFGINPFVLLSRVTVDINEAVDGQTEIVIVLFQNRAFYIYLTIVAMLFCVTFGRSTVGLIVFLLAIFFFTPAVYFSSGPSVKLAFERRFLILENKAVTRSSSGCRPS